MQADLREFLSRFVGTVLMTLLPVVVVTFLSAPITLGGHPGEPARDHGRPLAHMT